VSQGDAIVEELSVSQIGALRDLLAGYCGVYLDDSRSQTLCAAVRRRAALRGEAPAAYAASLPSPACRGELQAVAELLLNHETIFFRNRPHMEALRSHILPELHRRLPAGEPIRIWSAGCATGEEAYSIAIVASEALGIPPSRPVQILGTDLSEAALGRAEAGVYRGRTLMNLSEARRGRFFSPRGDALVAGPALRRLVRFERCNLLDPFPPVIAGVHLIFCQNVTIYFQVETCRALMGRFYDALAEGGALFLGFSETLWNIFSRFHWREISGSYVYYKESQRKPSQQAALVASGPPARPAPAGHAARAAAPPALPDEAALVEGARALIDAGDSAAALDLIASAPLRGERAPQMLALAARAHANRGDLDLAVAEARRALELDPLTTEAHLLMGLIYARQGQFGEAVRQLDRARYLDPEEPLIAFHMAECHRQAGRPDAAIREYRNVIRKLAGRPPDHLIDGVAVGWLAETCRRYVITLKTG
jgi:chemotaxis protein methyltransferase CheR